MRICWNINLEANKQAMSILWVKLREFFLTHTCIKTFSTLVWLFDMLLLCPFASWDDIRPEDSWNCNSEKQIKWLTGLSWEEGQAKWRSTNLCKWNWRKWNTNEKTKCNSKNCCDNEPDTITCFPIKYTAGKKERNRDILANWFQYARRLDTKTYAHYFPNTNGK